MSKIKEEFLNNFQQRFEGSELDRLRLEWEEQEWIWYLENQERPANVPVHDYDSSITEQSI